MNKFKSCVLCIDDSTPGNPRHSTFSTVMIVYHQTGCIDAAISTLCEFHNKVLETAKARFLEMCKKDN